MMMPPRLRQILARFRAVPALSRRLDAVKVPVQMVERLPGDSIGRLACVGPYAANPAILLSEQECDDTLTSVLAHELRHAEQLGRGAVHLLDGMGRIDAIAARLLLEADAYASTAHATALLAAKGDFGPRRADRDCLACRAVAERYDALQGAGYALCRTMFETIVFCLSITAFRRSYAAEAASDWARTRLPGESDSLSRVVASLTSLGVDGQPFHSASLAILAINLRRSVVKDFGADVMTNDDVLCV